MGGKSKMAKKILPYFPEHYCYVEPYGGGAGLLFAKTPSPVEVYNEINSDLHNLFYQTRNNGDELKRLIYYTDYGRETYDETSEYLRSNNWENPLERARAFYASVHMSFSGVPHNGHRLSCSRADAPAWANKSNHFDEFIERIRCVSLEKMDALEIIPRFDKPNTFIYADPPYVKETRTSTKIYEHEYTTEDHIKLLQTITECKQAKIMLSGYPNKLYDKHLKDWKTITFNVKKSSSRNSGKIKPMATEQLWMNYEPFVDIFEEYLD